MSGVESVFDGALAALLIMLAMGALHAPRLYVCVVLFIAFGLVLALTWARLGAPDLALAEAAIGAGLTGVLLLGVLARSPAEGVNIHRRGLSRRESAKDTQQVLIVEGGQAPENRTGELRRFSPQLVLIVDAISGGASVDPTASDADGDSGVASAATPTGACCTPCRTRRSGPI